MFELRIRQVCVHNCNCVNLSYFLNVMPNYGTVIPTCNLLIIYCNLLIIYCLQQSDNDIKLIIIILIHKL